MELALYFKRFACFAAMAFLLAMISGCAEKPVASPAPAGTTANNATDPSPAVKSGTGTAESDRSNGEKADKKSANPTADQPVAYPINDRSEEKGKTAAETAADKKPEEANEKEEKSMTDEEIAAENAKRREAALKEIIGQLGPPLVENKDKLIKAHPLYPVWIDKQNKQVVMQGLICQTNAPLEMFAVTTGTKEHEAIVAVPTEAKVVHTALVVLGAEPGKPVEFGPNPSDYKPATGTQIDIAVKWKDDKGKVQTARAQDWIKNVKTGKEMQESWVFGGSGFWKDDQTGIEYYQAEAGDFICVSNFPSAMLDLPIESSQSNDELMFQANPERVPPRNTPVTVILTPKLKPDKNDQPAKGEPEPKSSPLKEDDKKAASQSTEAPK